MYKDKFIIPTNIFPEVPQAILDYTRFDILDIWYIFTSTFSYIHTYDDIYSILEGHLEDVDWDKHELINYDPNTYTSINVLEDLVSLYLVFHVRASRILNFLRNPPLGISLEVNGFDYFNGLDNIIMTIAFVDNCDNEFHGPSFDEISGHYNKVQPNEMQQNLYTPIGDGKGI